MNAHGHGEVVLMGSSSQLFAVVADAYRRAGAINAGDEIVILESAHEVSSKHVSPVSLLFSLHGTVHSASQRCLFYIAGVDKQPARHTAC